MNSDKKLNKKTFAKSINGKWEIYDQEAFDIFTKLLLEDKLIKGKATRNGVELIILNDQKEEIQTILN